ncbi:MAG: hypothetical protein ACE14P_07665 [Methanotrichaceae archaeon]
MKLKIILLLAVMLICLSHPALSGTQCGTNWLGSDSNDQDFYVSKNQNLGVPSDAGTPAGSAANQPSVKLGQSAKANSVAIIRSLTPDGPSPQEAGTIITWTAAVDQKDLLFKFLLKGPATNNHFVEMTNWTASNVWIWNTTASDIGDSEIEVRVRDGKAIADPDSYDDRKDASFTIGEQKSKDSTSSLNDANPHPSSHTASTSITKTKPRIAPDERPMLPLSAGDPNGPNMSMPDPSPKPLGSTSSTSQATTDTSSSSSNEASTASEPDYSEPAPADIGGKWLVQFDNRDESMELILIQTGTSIMGSGSLIGDTKIPLTASGSLDSDKLKLDVKTVVGKYVNQIDKHYEMDLKLANRDLSGSYKAYSGETSTGKGRVVATRPGA